MKSVLNFCLSKFTQGVNSYWSFKLFRNIGYLVSYIGADLLAVNTMLWLGLIVPSIVFCMFLFMPETPEFLVKQGKVDVSGKFKISYFILSYIKDHEIMLLKFSIVDNLKIVS